MSRFLSLRPISLMSLGMVIVLSVTACGGGSSSGIGGNVTSVPLTGTVTPFSTPNGTSGSNIGGTTPDGTVIRGAAVVGESIPTQTVNATSVSGTPINVRHGFFPGNQPSTPAGSG